MSTLQYKMVATCMSVCSAPVARKAFSGIAGEAGLIDGCIVQTCAVKLLVRDKPLDLFAVAAKPQQVVCRANRRVECR